MKQIQFLIAKGFRKLKELFNEKRPSASSNDSSGVWIIDDTNSGFLSHFGSFDIKLAEVISRLLFIHVSAVVVDIGAGKGEYVKYLRNYNKELLVAGYDGNPHSRIISDKFVRVLNFAFPQKYWEHFTVQPDWVLCLRVGEYIPKKYEETFLNNIADWAGYGIIISWETESYPDGFIVNPQSNDYIEKQLDQRGFYRDRIAERILRSSARKHFYKNTLMVYRRK